MFLCLNPNCEKPDNRPTNRYCETCGTPLNQPCEFDHYRIIKCLGQGGFGRTYLAENLRAMNRLEVIKKLIPSQGNNQAAERLFQTEAQKLLELDNPHIPKFYSHFVDKGCYYLVQEYIDGQNLTEELQTKGRFDETKIREVLEVLVPVLDYIQDHNIIHRDIKPDNIMRRAADGQLFLIDFGAVREQVANESANSVMIYTPGYAAREHMIEPLRANLSIMPLDSEDELPRLPFLKIIKQR